MAMGGGVERTVLDREFRRLWWRARDSMGKELGFYRIAGRKLAPWMQPIHDAEM